MRPAGLINKLEGVKLLIYSRKSPRKTEAQLLFLWVGIQMYLQ